MKERLFNLRLIFPPFPSQVFDVKRDKLVVYIAHSDVSDSALKQNADYLFNVQAFTFHPKFRNRNRRDVGIIKLTEKIDFKGKHRKGVCAYVI